MLKDAWKQSIDRVNDILYYGPNPPPHTKNPTILGRINDTWLCLWVARLSDIVTEDGGQFSSQLLYSPPLDSPLNWQKIRHPLEYNMKLWIHTLRGVFYGSNGIFLVHLGPYVTIQGKPVLVTIKGIFYDTLNIYQPWYLIMLGNQKIVNSKIREIFALMDQGRLYAGSDESKKGGLESHAYSFTRCKEKDRVWLAITVGNGKEMPSLREEHGGQSLFF